MTNKKIIEIRKKLLSKSPLVHCITNPISLTRCADIILGTKCRPIMAEHPKEAAEITKNASSLLLNTGSITDARIKSMRISAKTAQKNEIPFIVDAVGAACSSLRRKYVKKLLKYRPTAIKGNYSEIKALYDENYRAEGVDAQKDLREEEVAEICVHLAKKYGTIVLASGKTDIVTDGEKLIYVNNGCETLSQITGTGCMLGALCACYIAASKDIYAIAFAAAVMGIAGELSKSEEGSGSFFTALADKISLIDEGEIEENLKAEEILIEKL